MTLRQKKQHFELLLQAISIEEDLVILNEVKVCFLANANRAAYILTWISIIEFLRRRIGEYETLGEANAKSAYEAILRQESQKKSADMLIVEKAKLISVISELENTDLEYCWSQRCIFAHPYELQPSNEAVLHIIRIAVAVISKPLFYKKPHITKQISDLSNKAYLYPSEIAGIRLAAQPFIVRIDPAIQQWSFNTLLYELGKDIEPTNPLLESASPEIDFNIAKRFRSYLIELLIHLGPEGCAKLPLYNKAIDFPFTVWYGCIDDETWNLFDSETKKVLIRYFQLKNCLQPLTLIKIVHKIELKGLLDKESSEIFQEKLSEFPLQNVYRYYPDQSKVFERTRALLDTSSYANNGLAIDFLLSIDVIDYFKPQQSLDLGILIGQCIRNNATRASNYVNHLIETNASEYLIEGIVTALIFQNSNILSFDKRFPKYFVKLANKSGLGESHLVSIVQKVNDFFVNGEHVLLFESVENLRQTRDTIQKEVNNPRYLIWMNEIIQTINENRRYLEDD
ncbi:hypothetical protein [Dyadobacter crusticola]|uniref:hypothetical protein n=1 Tax=Dyadobacter crusticola TaxID=292407 RepID=UPI0004E2395B|nr:hypothetical protein [Dyadobacter crusticola]